jgi:hypothetical protein
MSVHVLAAARLRALQLDPLRRGREDPGSCEENPEEQSGPPGDTTQSHRVNLLRPLDTKGPYGCRDERRSWLRLSRWRGCSRSGRMRPAGRDDGRAGQQEKSCCQVCCTVPPSMVSPGLPVTANRSILLASHEHAAGAKLHGPGSGAQPSSETALDHDRRWPLAGSHTHANNAPSLPTRAKTVILSTPWAAAVGAETSLPSPGMAQRLRAPRALGLVARIHPPVPQVPGRADREQVHPVRRPGHDARWMAERLGGIRTVERLHVERLSRPGHEVPGSQLVVGGLEDPARTAAEHVERRPDASHSPDGGEPAMDRRRSWY